MEELDNKTIMCSVFFLDIVGYSKKSVMGQISLKERFNSYLSAAIQDVPITDRIILDTGDGAAINFLGDVEDALKAALSLRESLLNEDPNLNHPLLVRMGINLGPVRLVRDINGQPNIVGDGINVAQRVMGFAEASQVLVSRSYFDAVSRLSPQYAEMFHYQGSRTDKHVREHEVYAIGYPGDRTSPKLKRQSKKVLAKAMDRTRTSLRPAVLGMRFLSTNLLQGFSNAGPVKRVMYALVIVIVLLVILEVTEEKLLGGSTAVAPIGSNDNVFVAPQPKVVAGLPASTPIVVAKANPEISISEPAPPQHQAPKKEEVKKKRSQNSQPQIEAAQKIDMPEDSTTRLDAYHKFGTIKDVPPRLDIYHKPNINDVPVKNEKVATITPNSVEGSIAADQAVEVKNSNISVSCKEGAEVFIDGARKGKLVSSVLTIPVSPGRHLVIVSHEKGMDWKIIKFKAGVTVFVNPDFCNH